MQRDHSAPRVCAVHHALAGIAWVLLPAYACLVAAKFNDALQGFVDVQGCDAEVKGSALPVFQRGFPRFMRRVDHLKDLQSHAVRHDQLGNLHSLKRPAAQHIRRPFALRTVSPNLDDAGNWLAFKCVANQSMAGEGLRDRVYLDLPCLRRV